jgi:hypothetical protein
LLSNASAKHSPPLNACYDTSHRVKSESPTGC